MKPGSIHARASLAALVSTAALAATPGAAHAGRSCEAQPPLAAKVQRSMELAERSARALDASGAQVVVIARAGQDLSKYGLSWSHIGLAYKDAAAGHTWRIVHKLNQCGSSRGDLYRQGLGEFFLDDMWDYRAAFAVPTPDLQRRLLALLADNARASRLHEPAYNMVAYPWAQQYQQSNQWAIETLASAADEQASSRERAQSWLKLKGYEPTTLRLGAFTRLGARMTAAHIAFDDHPNDKRFSDRIETVTADSVFVWLQRSGLAGSMQVQR